MWRYCYNTSLGKFGIITCVNPSNTQVFSGLLEDMHISSSSPRNIWVLLGLTQVITPNVPNVMKAIICLKSLFDSPLLVY